MSEFGEVPDKIWAEGLFVSNREAVWPGDHVEAKKNVVGSDAVLIKGKVYRVADFAESDLGTCSRHTRLKLDGAEGHFNPKRFRKC